MRPDVTEPVATTVGAILFLALLVAGLVFGGRAEVAGCEYTGEATPVGTKAGVQTAYRYRCDGVDRYSSVVPSGGP